MAKRVSTDEKLQKITDYFLSTSEVFTIKDLEKKLSKHCGISSMIVKDLLQKLIDENHIHQEKCGSTNLYWLFKNEKQHFYTCEGEKTEASIKKYESQNKTLVNKIVNLEKSRETSEERTVLLEKYYSLKKQIEEIDRIRDLQEKFPVSVFESMNSEIVQAKNSINQLTDDIFTLQNYVSTKFNLDRKSFNENFNVDEEMDYFH